MHTMQTTAANERARKEEEAAAAEAAIACTASATGHSALRHDGAATTTGRLNEAFALLGNQPKAAVRTKYRDGTWLHKSGALWPLHVLLLCAPCPCICAHAAKCLVSRGPGFNLKANAFTSLHFDSTYGAPLLVSEIGFYPGIVYTYIRSTCCPWGKGR
jgi:hypothetical protein